MGGMRDSKVDRQLLRRMWPNMEITREDLEKHFEVGYGYLSRVAKECGLPVRRSGPHRTSAVDVEAFSRAYTDPNTTTKEVADRFGITTSWTLQLASKLQLRKLRKGQVRREAAAPAPKVVSAILQTGGKYALLCAYADANGLSYNQALALWHRERVK